ncbi:unnamed protein product [Nippostrongylus brasiliensis]|uniref:AMP-binding domain-containing protein n=1 Tax=Nippostrongylus brasiliensis TaxID=27835 RepID=A0A0N4YFG0_NIPBR|nr:unnamed protein product [Nippostrongylus brasiliensis]
MDFLVKSPLVNSFDLSQIRYIYVGAARCDENLLRDLKRRLPNVKDVVQLFGLTEVGTLLFVTPVMNPQISSVGRAMPGVAAKILDENGDQLGPNEVGALMVQAETMMQGYYGKPERSLV